MADAGADRLLTDGGDDRDPSDGGDDRDPSDGGDDRDPSDGGDLATNDGQRFDRLPATDTERTVAGRASREAVVDYFADRFGIPPESFDGHTFWEKGAGKIWIYAGEAPDPIEVEALGMTCLRTRQEHWKPTTDVVQRFGRAATTNVIELTADQARSFANGDDQDLDWDGDWGYLIAAHEVAGAVEPIGVGRYLHGELQSMIPKGRRRWL